VTRAHLRSRRSTLGVNLVPDASTATRRNEIMDRLGVAGGARPHLARVPVLHRRDLPRRLAWRGGGCDIRRSRGALCRGGACPLERWELPARTDSSPARRRDAVLRIAPAAARSQAGSTDPYGGIGARGPASCRADAVETAEKSERMLSRSCGLRFPPSTISAVSPADRLTAIFRRHA
jgi:hypothetical protein